VREERLQWGMSFLVVAAAPAAVWERDPASAHSRTKRYYIMERGPSYAKLRCASVLRAVEVWWPFPGVADRRPGG